MRFLISGYIQAQGFGLEPEPIKLVVEAASLERACAIARAIYPNLQLEQARIATVSEGSALLFEVAKA
jgi:hypothetical protein